jgi:flavodoxin
MIFYFTATGNGKFIADKIAAVTGERVMDIADCMKNNRTSFTLDAAEALGFVAPVYYYGLPIIVVDFMRKLNFSLWVARSL